MPVDWVEERSGLVSVGKYFLFRNVPKDISWLQTLGASLLTVFIVQVTTGILLAMYYKPDPVSAFASIQYITDEATLGWLVRGMHKWGSSVMVILLFLHMGRVFVFGAYKYPREMTWVTGAVIFILVMMMSLTGYLLVFDQRAYWATDRRHQHQRHGAHRRALPDRDPERRAGVLARTRSSRFYSLHMLVIPSLIAALIALHLWLVIRLGVTSPPWSKHRVKDG